MRNWNRVWIFFVIVAIGLVLSWGQIGRKAGRVPIRGLLDTETPCQPFAAPCAAFGTDIALVLGPGPGTDLLLAALARPLPLSVKVEIAPAGEAKPLPVDVETLSGGRWRLRLARHDWPPQTRLYVELKEASVSAVFPLVSQ